MDIVPAVDIPIDPVAVEINPIPKVVVSGEVFLKDKFSAFIDQD